MKTLLTFILLLYAFTGFCQDSVSPSIYIVRPKNYIGSLRKMKLNVNGERIVLPKNAFIQFPVKDSSINIVSSSKRLRKHSKALQINVAASTYIMAYFSVIQVKGWPKDVVVLQPICKECFIERKENCMEVKSK